MAKVVVSKDEEKQAGKTIVRSCTCVNEFQDQQFQRGMRAHNVGKGKVRCTSCGTEKLK